MFTRTRLGWGALLAVALAATFLVSLSADQDRNEVGESFQLIDGTWRIDSI